VACSDFFFFFLNKVLRLFLFVFFSRGNHGGTEPPSSEIFSVTMLPLCFFRFSTCFAKDLCSFRDETPRVKRKRRFFSQHLESPFSSPLDFFSLQDAVKLPYVFPRRLFYFLPHFAGQRHVAIQSCSLSSMVTFPLLGTQLSLSPPSLGSLEHRFL